MKLLIVLALLSLPAWAGDFTVSGQGLPSTATSPTSDQGKALTTSVKVTLLVIANTSSSSQTVTVNDCQGTPFYMFKAYPIAALTTWVLSLGQGVNFSGCLQWSAPSAAVMGTISGTQ